MTRNLKDPLGRLLNHVEFVYAPGERELAKRLFRALGCRVVDPQEDDAPEETHPSARHSCVPKPCVTEHHTCIHLPHPSPKRSGQGP